MKRSELTNIQTMWNKEKLTSTEIAKRINKTRNAVMGIVNRAREAGWIFDHREQVIPKKPVFPKPTKRKLKSRPKLIEVTIIELEQYHCKAVIGRSKRNNLPTYCGKLRLENSAYCAECSAMFSHRSAMRYT